LCKWPLKQFLNNNLGPHQKAKILQFWSYTIRFRFNLKTIDFQNALNSSMDDSKKRSTTTTITSTQQKTHSNTQHKTQVAPLPSQKSTQSTTATSVRVSICDRGTAIPSAIQTTTPVPDLEAPKTAAAHANSQFQQVQCKLSNNGPISPTVISSQVEGIEPRSPRETVLPTAGQLSRRSSRENNGLTGEGPPSRTSMTSVSNRGRPGNNSQWFCPVRIFIKLF
jgi:hypothetical protein